MINWMSEMESNREVIARMSHVSVQRISGEQQAWEKQNDKFRGPKVSKKCRSLFKGKQLTP